MRIVIVPQSSVDACPWHQLGAEHYWPDGVCKCVRPVRRVHAATTIEADRCREFDPMRDIESWSPGGVTCADCRRRRETCDF